MVPQKAGINKTLTDFVAEARAFAYDTYLPALFKGNRIDEVKKMEITRSLTYFTGLNSTYVQHADLKILINRFRSELLRDSNLVLGQLDGRYTSAEIDRTADSPTLGDPASYKIEAAYTALLYDYFGNELGVTMKRPYLTGNDDIYPKWNWKTTPEGQGWEPSYVNTAPQLATTLRRNPNMRILVASGYYDLITPFFDAEYTFSRHGFTKDQIEFKYYQAGHMMYNRREDFESLSKDLLKFYTQK
ncbi:MAG: hypothetical protein IPN29_18030 [Saprospiraceae bacterium]|nr:hypothetical protein [Saprospiraceae bacterium]